MLNSEAEKKFWDYLSGLMKTYWDAQRHEDKYTEGIPDVSYGVDGCQGWIELKVFPRWPVGDDTPLRLGHFTPLQRNWLKRRKEIAHRGVFLLLKVDTTFLLFDDVEAFSHVGKDWGRLKLMSRAKRSWENYISAHSLRMELQA